MKRLTSTLIFGTLFANSASTAYVFSQSQPAPVGNIIKGQASYMIDSFLFVREIFGL